MPPRIRLPVSDMDLKILQDSGLTDRTILENDLYTKFNALVFPYRDIDGTVNCFARLRPHDPPIINGKPAKYIQPPDSPLRAYFPAASLEKLRDGKSDVFITEGEKKAMALAQLGVAAIGLGGIWCGLKDGTLIDDLQKISWKGRTVFICFDYDPKTATRCQAAIARGQLATELRKQGAKVFGIDLPEGPRKTKQGVDDFLQAHRENGSEEFWKLVAAAQTARRGKKKKEKDEETKATKLVRYAQEELELWHTPDLVGYASTFSSPRHSWPLRSTHCHQFLSRLFYMREKESVSADTRTTAIATLEGLALYDGPEHPVFVRLAEWEGKIYLYLGDAARRVVEVGPDGWKIIDNCPVKFRHPRGMLPLSEPVRGGSVEKLKPLVNVSDRDWILIIAFLLCALRPGGPFFVLLVYGQQGAAKSMLARLLRLLLDPNEALLRSEPKEPRDLSIAANNGWILTFDNLSFLPPWLSDCICRLATGGGFSTRLLHTDDDERIFNAKRPVILNAIEEVGTRGDLLDRSLVVNLSAIEKKKRLTEDKVKAKFAAIAPEVLGGLLDAVSVGLKNLPNVNLTELPRMADCATWVTACEPALGWEPESFVRAYEENTDSANDVALDASNLTAPLRDFMKVRQGNWKGTPTELLSLLTPIVSEQVARSREWPKNAQVLSGRLSRITPNLKRVGILVESGHDGTSRFISIRTEGENCVKSVSDVNPPENKAKNDGDCVSESVSESVSGSRFKPDLGGCVRGRP